MIYLPIDALSAALARCGAGEAQVALVLGSGLGSFSARLEAARVVPYAELAAMPCSAVPGHAGRLVIGAVAGVRVVVLEGRVHRYEGWSAEEVTRAVRALARLGVRTLVLTNAAGGIVADWSPPLLMRVDDHIDLQSPRVSFPDGDFSFPSWGLHASDPCASISSGLQVDALAHRPLHRSELRSTDGLEERTTHQREQQYSSPYDPELGRAIELAAWEAGIPTVHGIYAGLLGPTYETPAEIRMLRWMGADAVGMSTVAEAAAARAAGMRVAAISAITNAAAGITPGKLSHAEVVAAGARLAQDFCALLTAAIPRLTD